MVRERVLKRSEFGKFLECHCYDVGPPKVGQSQEKRYGGSDCTCTITQQYRRGKRGELLPDKIGRPFRVGHSVVVGSKKSYVK